MTIVISLIDLLNNAQSITNVNILYMPALYQYTHMLIINFIPAHLVIYFLRLFNHD